jgi:hypothetical protein
MKKLTLIISIIALFTVSALAQKADDAKDTLAVVNKLFAEMEAHNPPGILAVFTKEAQLAAVIKTKDGKSLVRTFPVEGFSKNFAEKKGEIKEDMYDPQVKTFGDLALIWGRYVFFVDGKISHCGVNAFHLVRAETGWVIANASTTIDPNGCTDAEKLRKMK